MIFFGKIGRRLRLACTAETAVFFRAKENHETRKKALRHKGFLLFLTPSALSAAVSEYHAVANGRDTPDSGRRREPFLATARRKACAKELNRSRGRFRGESLREAHLRPA